MPSAHHHLLLLLGLWVFVSNADTTSLGSVTIPDSMGVNIHFTRPMEGEMDMLVEGGWKWVRMDCTWQAVEKQKGVYDWSDYDALMKMLNDRNMRAILILDYANTLYDGGLPPFSDEGIAAFVSFAVAGATRFKGMNIFWECWNEPDGSFWPPKANATAYANLCSAVGKGIKATLPDEVVIGPAVSSMHSIEFMRDVFKSGILEDFDMVSTHGYGNSPPEEWLLRYDETRVLIDHYTPKGRDKIPMVNSEWGFDTPEPGAADKPISGDTQGMYLARAYLTSVSVGAPVSIWYDWHDDCVNWTNSECTFGTVANHYYPGRSPVYDAKPSYHAAHTLSHTLSGMTYSKRLLPDVEHPLAHALAFTAPSGGVSYAVWTMWSGAPHATFGGVPEGQCFNVTTWLGGSAPEVCAEGTVLHVEVSEGPMYLVSGE